MELKNSSRLLMLGEASDLEYIEQIELESWDWNVKRNTKSERSAKPAEPDVFSFSKQMDKSTTQMLNKMKTGEKLSATLTMVEGSDLPFKLVIQLKDIRVIDYSLTAKDEEKSAEITEDWEFHYGEITFEHSPDADKRTKQRVMTLTSTLKRSADAAKGSNAAKEIVSKFTSSSESDQTTAASELKQKFPKIFPK